MKAFFSLLHSLRTIIFVFLGLALLGGVIAWYFWVNAGSGGPAFRTETVVRKNLSATISATGTLEPQDQAIDVGTQVAGLIMRFGPADPDPNDPMKSATPNGPTVDYCSVVKAGQILAWIDPTIYGAQVKQATAALAVAKANLEKSQANRDGALDTYQRDARSPTAIAPGQVYVDKAAYEAAAADCKLQEATITQAEANLKVAQTNLDYCTIKAPLDSPTYTIIDRRVNVGQTVVASLSTPSLFLLAKDLTQMQVWASVNEADIGNIHATQEVSFTVNARPGKTYQGVVNKIRLNASMTQNVVTYTVVVDTTNRMIAVAPQGHAKKSGAAAKTPPQQSSSAAAPAANKGTVPSEDTLNTTPAQEWELLPYETANLTFHVDNRENALLVPNAALRWRPQLQQVDPKYSDEYEQSLRKKASKDSSGGDSTETPKTGTDSADKNPAKPHNSGGASSHGMVWVEVPGSDLVRPIKLQTGLTDGAMTEVVSVVTSGIHEGDTLDEKTELVTGATAAKGAAATTNPFAPKIFQPQQPKKQDQ